MNQQTKSTLKFTGVVYSFYFIAIIMSYYLNIKTHDWQISLAVGIGIVIITLVVSYDYLRRKKKGD